MKNISIAIGIALVLIVGAVGLSQRTAPITTPSAGNTNVTMVDGTQVVAITAKGGYTPRKSVARAGVPTTLRITTKGTFDCSSAFTIPALNYSTHLPASGVVDVPIPPQQAGTTLAGSCGMGMYTMQVTFE